MLGSMQEVLTEVDTSGRSPVFSPVLNTTICPRVHATTQAVQRFASERLGITLAGVTTRITGNRPGNTIPGAN